VSDTAASAAAPRRRRGVWSAVLAFVALGFGIVSVAVFAGLPRNSPPLARDAGLGLFLAAMLVVPVCHVVGPRRALHLGVLRQHGALSVSGWIILPAAFFIHGVVSR
jgi:peptidoglycan/LPS O-acetylase OafA/YrhL